VRRNTKGFTLVELIVSIAILAVLILAIMGFVATGAQSYRTVSADVTLQTLSQQALGQLESYLIDCNGGVCLSGSTLYAVNRADDGSCTVYVFRYDESAQALYFGSRAAITDAASEPPEAADMMTRNLTGFSVAFADGTTVDSADVTLNFAFRGQTLNAAERVALRNHPAAAASYGELLAACLNP